MEHSNAEAAGSSRYSFLRAFENDRAFDPDELAVIEKVAYRDRAVDDDDERSALARVFARVRRGMVTPEVWDEIQRFKRRFGI